FHHCFLLYPRQPSATLFPYTTLFRSGDGVERERGLSRSLLPEELHHPPPRVTAHAEGPVQAHRPGGDDGDLLLDVVLPEPHHRPDRKSTRLNSSHVAISYAVFCLKKK